MNRDRDLMVERFHAIKNLGFVKSRRSNNTGTGKTFEDYIGVIENNLEEPDFAGFEIKSHRSMSQSYITLFTKVPSFPKGANTYLRNTYGESYDDALDLKSLHTSIFADRRNTYMQRLSFKLLDNPISQTITIGIYDMDGNLIDNRVGYTYQDVECCLKKKLHNLFYVTAETQIQNREEYFYFKCADIYMEPSLERFMTLLREGKIMYDIRIGSYKSGAKRGKIHDHGSGFRILEGNMRLLYAQHEIVE